MGTITLSVPNDLKSQMDSEDRINWSSVARRAFAETLNDLKHVELVKKVRQISEISDDDKREVKQSIVDEVIKSTERASKEFKLGKRKAMTLEEFDKHWESL